jgi:dihydrodipicolinate synthase/N-acetylneuraminate lyase
VAVPDEGDKHTQFTEMAMWTKTTYKALSSALAREYRKFWEAVDANDIKKAMSYAPTLRRLENACDRLVFGRQR